ncbi:MAG: hypothetical protein V3U37_05515 [Nitrospinaceae bacterium]
MTDPRPVEDSIKHSIASKGFPGSVVRLPFKPVYGACKEHGTSLTEVLNHLKAEDIYGTLQENHIEFRSLEKHKENKQAGASDSAETSWINGLPNLGNLKNIQEAAKAYLGKMTPDQMAEIRRMAENLSDEEKKNILKMFTRKTDPGTP